MQSKYNWPKIFQGLSNLFEEDEITSLDDLDLFLNELLTRTDGWVIVDFIDEANWDNLHSYKIDKSNRFLYLNWRDYREIDGNNNVTDDFREVSRMIFPASVYGMIMHFQSLIILRLKEFPVFLLRGYTLTDKQIRNAFSRDTDEFEMKKYSFHSRRLIRSINGFWEDLFCINTPIASVIIVPKRTGFSTRDSKFILYQYNVVQAVLRLRKVMVETGKITERDTDFLFEKANTIRRIMENVLKVECTYRGLELNKNYSKFLLGDLIKLLENFHDADTKTSFGKIAQWANELSHDSGIPATKEKVMFLCETALDYAVNFLQSIKSDYI